MPMRERRRTQRRRRTKWWVLHLPDPTRGVGPVMTGWRLCERQVCNNSVTAGQEKVSNAGKIPGKQATQPIPDTSPTLPANTDQRRRCPARRQALAYTPLFTCSHAKPHSIMNP